VPLTAELPGMKVIRSVSKKRKRVEEIFGWMKTRRWSSENASKASRSELVGWMFTFTAAAYNLVRIRNLSKSVAGANA